MTRALDVANDLSTFQSKYNNGVLDNVTLTNSIIDTTTTTNGTFTLSGNLKIPENYGIDFNNFGSNLLDDYEEGTWTPLIETDDGAGNLSSSGSGHSAIGRYIKIGKMVYIEGEVDTNTRTLISSYLTIKNVPFIAEMTFKDSPTSNSAAPTVLWRKNISGGNQGSGRVQGDYIQITSHPATGASADFSYSCFFMVI